MTENDHDRKWPDYNIWDYVKWWKVRYAKVLIVSTIRNLYIELLQQHWCNLIYICHYMIMPYSYSNVLYLPLVSLLFRSKISKIDRVLKSEEGHFSPLVEEVKHLSNPLILRFSFEKSLKSTDFCLLGFLFWVGKDNLHYSDWLRFLHRSF